MSPPARMDCTIFCSNNLCHYTTGVFGVSRGPSASPIAIQRYALYLDDITQKNDSWLDKNDKGTELFLRLDENARHSTHSIEATQEATRVVACIVQHCETLASRSSVHQEVLISRCEILKFHHTLMLGFLARAFANDRRVGHSKDLVKSQSHCFLRNT